MKTAFDDAKITFFLGLRNDVIVKDTGAEQKIRELIEVMTAYIDHANLSNFHYHRKMDKCLSHVPDKEETELKELTMFGLEAVLKDMLNPFFKEKSNQMRPDFSDLRSIAYTVGTYKDERGWLQRMLAEENPLDPLVTMNERHYESFSRTGSLETTLFDEEIVKNLEILLDPSLKGEKRILSHTELMKKCCHYLNRQGTLLRLADHRKILHAYYDEEISDQNNRGYKKHDWSWLIADWDYERLTRKQTGEIAGYFKRQSEIDGLHFRSLLNACLRLGGDAQPNEKTDTFHRTALDFYKHFGFLRVVYTPEPDNGLK